MNGMKGRKSLNYNMPLGSVFCLVLQYADMKEEKHAEIILVRIDAT